MGNEAVRAMGAYSRSVQSSIDKSVGSVGHPLLFPTKWHKLGWLKSESNSTHVIFGALEL